MLTNAIPFPDISPVLVEIPLGFTTLPIRWYALAYIVGILLGWRLVVRAVRTPRLWPEGKPVMTAQQVEDLLFWVILGVILGGRLGYVLFYQPGSYLTDPLRILMLWEGGMSFHGGALGVIVAALLYTWRHGLPPLPVGDLITLGLAPGLLLGRIANFITQSFGAVPPICPGV